MKPLCLLLLGFLLSACGSVVQTKNPAQAYAGTKVYREKDGSLQVVADWEIVAFSDVTDPPQAAASGFKAHIIRGKASYSHYTIDAEYQPKAGAMHTTPEDVTGRAHELAFPRATLEQAARGSGITVPIPKYHTRQTVSAAYLQGFLQKVDEVLRNPADAGARVLTEPWYRVH